MEDIIRKAKQGEVEAIKSIIFRYRKLIFKRSHYYNVPGYSFEDLVQHGYLSVIKAIKMYKLGSNSCDGYFINTINLNYAALLKGTIKHFREVPDENILNKDEGYELTIEDEIIAYDEVKKLYKALDKLEPIQREMLEKHYFHGKEFKEVAATNQIEYYKSIRIKNQALKKLRRILE